MAEPDYQTAKAKALDQYLLHQQRYLNHRSKHIQAGRRAWEIHIDCYLQNNSECIHDFNQLYLQHHRISREKNAQLIKCRSKCDEDSGIVSESKIPTSMEELNQFRNYYACLKPCVEKLITYTNKEIEVLDKEISIVNRYLQK